MVVNKIILPALIKYLNDRLNTAHVMLPLIFFYLHKNQCPNNKNNMAAATSLYRLYIYIYMAIFVHHSRRRSGRLRALPEVNNCLNLSVSNPMTYMIKIVPPYLTITV